MVVAQKNDFIELEFTGIVRDTNEVFDTTNKEEAKKLGVTNVDHIKPVILSVGNHMTVMGLDNALVGKELGKEYFVEVKAEEAFGKRDPEMVKMIPLHIFTDQKIMPEKDMQIAMDGQVVKIVYVSGGRVLTDFNNPLAGRVLIYKYKILRILEDQNEKISALQDFFFQRRFDFEVRDKDLTMKVDEKMQKFVEIMAKPFEEILGLKVIVEVLVDGKKEEENNKK